VRSHRGSNQGDRDKSVDRRNGEMTKAIAGFAYAANGRAFAFNVPHDLSADVCNRRLTAVAGSLSATLILVHNDLTISLAL
jgi:hypothetical protein